MTGEPRAFEAAKVSLIGARPSNQDRCLVLCSHDTVLLGLADGLGGHPRGEVAAQLLIDVSETLFRQAEKPIYDPEHFMLQCVGKAHHAILRYGRRQTPPISPRTTAVLAIVQNGIAYWAHVGDSRLYLIRDGEIQAQTRDHSQVRFVRQSADEASRPKASLTRCLGGMPQPPTTTCGTPTLLLPGDTLILCSDGFWAQVPRDALLGSLSVTDEPLDSHLQALAGQAAAVPNSDNVTATALRWCAAPRLSADSTGAPAPDSDPRLDRAIEHLHNVLGKSNDQQR